MRDPPSELSLRFFAAFSGLTIEKQQQRKSGAGHRLRFLKCFRERALECKPAAKCRQADETNPKERRSCPTVWNRREAGDRIVFIAHKTVKAACFVEISAYDVER